MDIPQSRLGLVNGGDGVFGYGGPSVFAASHGVDGNGAAGETGDWLLYPDHEPVLTVGRNPSDGNVLADAATLARAGVEVLLRVLALREQAGIAAAVDDLRVREFARW